MKNFDLTRFANFGKYDFTINKAFYRNISLVTIFGSVGIALMGFVLRWNMLESARNIAQHLDEDPDRFDLFGSANPELLSVTALFILGFCLIMMEIFAGYSFHNLRNKQGRITELTIPATNCERWTWHILTVTVGGFLCCVASVLCADAVNAILNLAVYGTKVSSSVTAEVCRIMLFIPNEGGSASYTMNDAFNTMGRGGVINYFRVLVACAMYFGVSIYIFGNSVKYRYNIILTYIATQVISFVLLISSVIIGSHIDWNWLDEAFPVNDEETAKFYAKCLYYFVITLMLTLGSLLLWGSYRLYCKAQITSRINR